MHPGLMSIKYEAVILISCSQLHHIWCCLQCFRNYPLRYLEQPTRGSFLLDRQGLCATVTLFSGCQYEGYGTRAQRHEHRRQEELLRELDFEVRNDTEETAFITCFYYTKKATGYRWRWYKSPVYELEPGERAIVDIDTIPSKRDRDAVYGYLAVFHNEVDARTSVYELLEDTKRVDLEKLTMLRDKIVIIQEREYGFKGEVLDYSMPKREDVDHAMPELDFVIENQTDEDLWLATFIYQKKGRKPQWKFVKIEPQHIPSGQEVLVDVGTIAAAYDRVNVRAFLGLFKEDEFEAAQKATYENLSPRRRLKVGKLYQIRDRHEKVVLRRRKYGLEVTHKHEPVEWFYEFELAKRPHPIRWYRR